MQDKRFCRKKSPTECDELEAETDEDTTKETKTESFYVCVCVYEREVEKEIY